MDNARLEPAEIINKTKTSSYFTIKELITNNIWAEQRFSLVIEMLEISMKTFWMPYIDIRLCFNSYSRDLNDQLAEKLVNFTES